MTVNQVDDDGEVDDDGQAVLFGVPELHVDVDQLGRVEASCHAAITAGVRDGVVIDVDAGLVGIALATARRLDQAEALANRGGGAVAMKAGYLYAQLVPPYQALLHGLRLPAEVEPASEPRGSVPTAGGDVPSWVHDAVGRPE